jgi:hypothetical protein
MPQLRYETKIPLQGLQLIDLRSAFITVGVTLKQSFADRMVHSIYMDTLDFDDYYDNISGISQRSKTRIRWYNESTENMALEIKKKNGKISQKEIMELSNPSGLIPRNLSLVNSLFSVNPNKPVSTICPLRRPVLEIQYCRQYFQIASGIRVTVDRDIRCGRLLSSRSIRMTKFPVGAVVEFKYGADQRQKFLNLIRGLPFRPFRHSKYVIGLDVAGVG